MMMIIIIHTYIAPFPKLAQSSVISLPYGESSES